VRWIVTAGVRILSKWIIHQIFKSAANPLITYDDNIMPGVSKKGARD
jgi:hypothetical protein